jgi:hypothetical protein
MSRNAGAYGWMPYRIAWSRTFSSPVRFWSRLGRWKMIPMRRRTAPASLTRSCPAISAEPPLGSRVVVRIEIVVVLPAPFGPSSAKNSPAPTSNEMPSTAFRVALR